MKLKTLIGLVVLAIACAVFASRFVSEPAPAEQESAVAAASALNTVIDVDHPPTTVNVFFGGTITITRQGNHPKSFVQVHAYSTDGRGELFIQLPGGPIGTVATLRPMRTGSGVIQISVTNPGPGQSGFKTIFVYVR